MEVRINGVKSKQVQTKSIHFAKERLILGFVIGDHLDVYGIYPVF